MIWQRTSLPALAVICLALATCERKAPRLEVEAGPGAAPTAERVEPGPDAEVRASFLRFAAALEAHDKRAVLSELAGTPAELETAGAFLDYLAAGSRFEAALRKAHGDAGWEAFNDTDGAQLRTEMKIDRRQLEDMETQIQGDRASTFYSGGGPGPTFIREAGAWKIEAVTIFPADPSGDQAARFLAFADVLNDAIPRAEDPSADTEQLDQELGERMAAAAAAP